MIFCSKIQKELRNINIKCKIFDIDNIYDTESVPTSILNKMLISLDFFKIGEKLIWIGYKKSLKLCKYIISHDLAYSTKFTEDKKSEELCNSFMGIFKEEPLFFTNIDSNNMDLTGSYGLNPVSEYTFSACLLIIGKNKCGILCQEAED